MGDVQNPSMAVPGGDVVRLSARAFERDRYLAALLAPRAARDGLIALAAFAGEIARIPASVSEPMAGEIRLQWFRDSIDAFAAGHAAATGHPIADALGQAMRRHALPAALLHDVIDAQSERLHDHPFADLAALSANLRKLDGGMFRLACGILAGPGPRRDATFFDIAGEAYGLARVLIEAPVELSQGRILFPLDMTQAHGLAPADARGAEDPADARGAKDKEAWRSLSRALGELARARFTALAEGFQRAPADVRTATLPVALVRPYLGASQRADIAALEVCDIGPLTRVWRLWLAHMTGRF